MMRFHFDNCLVLKEVKQEKKPGFCELMTCKNDGCVNYVDNKYMIKGLMKRTVQCGQCQQLWKRYRIHTPRFNQMIAEQNNSCAICNKDFIEKEDRTTNRRNYHIDHCHDTKEVRGILCSQCNQMIGLAYEDPKILSSAIKYLENL